MKILILAPLRSPKGPIPIHTPWLVKGLKDLECEVDTAYWGGGANEQKISQKIRGRIQDIRSIRRKVKSQHFDVVVVKTAHDWFTLARDIPLIVYIKPFCSCIILQFHGSWTKSYPHYLRHGFKWLTSYLISKVNGGLVLSHEEVRLWNKLNKKVPFYKVKNPYLSYVTVDESNELRKRSSFPFVIFFCGRLIKEKGIYELISAFSNVAKQYDCQLHIAGSGKEERNIAHLINQLGIENKVTFRGWLEGEALRKVYQQADLFILPSWSEGFPFVLYEAMEAGLPIITTNMRGMADELIEGENALFVPPCNVDALTDAIKTILSDSQLRAKMRKNNQRKIQAYSPSIVAKDYLEKLKKICWINDNEG